MIEQCFGIISTLIKLLCKGLSRDCSETARRFRRGRTSLPLITLSSLRRFPFSFRHFRLLCLDLIIRNLETREMAVVVVIVVVVVAKRPNPMTSCKRFKAISLCFPTSPLHSFRLLNSGPIDKRRSREPLLIYRSSSRVYDPWAMVLEYRSSKPVAISMICDRMFHI